MLKLFRFAAVLAVPALIISGCGKRDTDSGSDTGYLAVKGSDTMVHMASTWAEDFMEKQDGIEVSVTGGGSGAGIAALINGSCDICAASRKIKDKEVKLAEEQGFTPEQVIVAKDGIAVVVNPANPISELSMQQLEKLFTGEAANWSQVGGSDNQVVVLSRESSSGTYVFFQKKVLSKKDYAPKAKLMPATSAIIQAVSDDKWSIGYVGLGYAQAAKGKVKVLGVKANADSPAVMPSTQSVVSGDYVIARPLNLYIKDGSNPKVRKFIDYCLGPDGQKVVVETGYVAVK